MKRLIISSAVVIFLLTACASTGNVIKDDAYYSPYEDNSSYNSSLVTSNSGYFDSNSVKTEKSKIYKEYASTDSLDVVVDTVYIVENEPSRSLTISVGTGFGVGLGLGYGWGVYYWDPYWYPGWSHTGHSQAIILIIHTILIITHIIHFILIITIHITHIILTAVQSAITVTTTTTITGRYITETEIIQDVKLITTIHPEGL